MQISGKQSTATDQMSDADLLELFVRNGDRDAMDALLSRHIGSALRVARRILRNFADAEDAVQTAFAEILTHAARNRKGTRVKSWIIAFVSNTCRNKLRENFHRLARQNVVAREKAANTWSVPPDRDLYHKVLCEIENLPEHYRTPIWLHFVEGRTSAEVAAMLNYPAGTVRSNISRGVEQIRARKICGNKRPCLVTRRCTSAWFFIYRDHSC